MPEVAKATNIEFENNVITWKHNDDNVKNYELKFFYTYDGLDFYELGHWDADSLTSYTVTENDWNPDTQTVTIQAN